MGDGDRARRDQLGALAALRQRDGRAAARPGWPHHGLHRSRGDGPATWRVGHRRSSAAAGHGDSAGGGWVHGQRIRADASSGLRHAARDARRSGAHAARSRFVRVTLLGPQRRPTLDIVAASLGLEGPIATVTAGWQEREPADAVLSEQLSSRDVNLALYRRWLEVQDRDPEFAVAQRQLQGVLEEAQDIYLLRLDHALQAVYAVQRRGGSTQLRLGELAEAVVAVRDLDAAHLLRISNVRREFYETWQPHD